MPPLLWRKIITAYRKGVDVANGSDSFFSEVISWAMNRGLEVEMADKDVLFLNMKERFVAMVDESGVLAYHHEAHDILDEVTKLRKRIPRKEKRECS